jgi:flagellar motor protein MotB
MVLKAPKGFISENDGRVSKSGHPAPAWLWPYADLMTELVAFFIILYAFAAALDPTAQKAKADIEKEMDEGGIAGDVEMTREGLRITLEEYSRVPYFESGYADLTPKMMSVLDRIAPIMREAVDDGRPLIVEGHTDNIPIKNDYFWGNWELSTARATMVTEYLIDRKGFPPECMGAVGFAEHQPVAPNDSVENRRRNRRVVFFIKNTSLQKKKHCLGKKKPRDGPAAAENAGGEEKDPKEAAKT